MERPLTGKTLLITGGTSRLGEAFVRRAVAAGGAVHFTYHRGAASARALAQAGATGHALDLADRPAMDAFAREFKQSVKALDVLIHNAAAIRDARIEDMEEADWDYVMAVDLKAPYYLTKKLMPLLFKKRPSKVFMLTSRAAWTGAHGAANYAAAKAGLVGLARSLAQELGKKEILVNLVNPGFMRSRMTEHLDEKIIQAHIASSPLGRDSSPEEVAEFLVYLSSDRMAQVTGQVFHWESRRNV